MIALFLWISMAVAHAEGPALGRASLEHTWTSEQNRLLALRLSYDHERRDFFWNYPGETETGTNWTVRTIHGVGAMPSARFQSHDLRVGASHRWTPMWETSAELGAGILESQTTPSWSLGLKAMPDPSWNAEVSVQHRWMAMETLQIAAVSEHLSAHDVNASLAWRVVEPVRVIARGLLREWSDHQSSKDLDMACMYGIGLGDPWIWVGLGGERIGYDHRRTGLWSPTRFWAWGPRTELAWTFRPEWAIAGGLNLNRFKEEDFAWGQGFYASAEIRYGSRDSRLWSAEFQKTFSSQLGSQWQSTTLFAQLATSL